MAIKKKYTEKDYQYVLNKIMDSWSDPTPPNTIKIMKDLKKSKKRMDEEYEYWKEMDE